MNIGIVLIHNKLTKGNEEQIVTLKSLIEIKQEFLDGKDDKGSVVKNAFVQNYFSLIGLSIPHKAYIYHIVPFQPNNKNVPYSAILPAGMYDIYSGGVQFGKGGGENFTGNHPHFFNWAMERLFHENIDIMLYLQDLAQLSIVSLQKKISPLADPLDPTEYSEDTYGKLCTHRLYKKIPNIVEHLPLPQALNVLKNQALQEGMKNG